MHTKIRKNVPLQLLVMCLFEYFFDRLPLPDFTQNVSTATHFIITVLTNPHTNNNYENSDFCYNAAHSREELRNYRETFCWNYLPWNGKWNCALICVSASDNAPPWVLGEISQSLQQCFLNHPAKRWVCLCECIHIEFQITFVESEREIFKSWQPPQEIRNVVGNKQIGQFNKIKIIFCLFRGKWEHRDIVRIGFLKDPNETSIHFNLYWYLIRQTKWRYLGHLPQLRCKPHPSDRLVYLNRRYPPKSRCRNPRRGCWNPNSIWT